MFEFVITGISLIVVLAAAEFILALFILWMLGGIMADALQPVKDAIADLVTAVQAGTKAISDAIAQLKATTDPTEVAALHDAIEAQASSISMAAASLEGTLTPPPNPTP